MTSFSTIGASDAQQPPPRPPTPPSPTLSTSTTTSTGTSEAAAGAGARPRGTSRCLLAREGEPTEPTPGSMSARKKQKKDPAETMIDECLALAESVAREAGQMIREAHERRDSLAVHVESKGSVKDKKNVIVDLVTETDKKCEDYIIETIKKRFPGHAFIGEESSFTGPGGGAPSGPLELSDAPTWIIDPLDGTTNYVHGFPAVTVSIGLAVDKELVVGVIHNPLLDQTCVAAKGRGCLYNGKAARVAQAKKVTEAVIVNNMGASRNPDVNCMATDRLLALLQSNVRGLRNTGSAAQNMMDVARGVLDSYYEDGFGGPWDVAAGKVIVEEAGGVLRHHLGGPFVLMGGKGQVLCGNAEVTKDIARILKGVKPRKA